MRNSRTSSLVAAALVATVTVTSSPGVGRADHTSDPASVAIAGSLQSELGCPDDWLPDCSNTELAFDADDGVWQAGYTVPAGAYEYKAALNDSWAENYGANAIFDGPNIPLAAPGGTVKFYYDPETHWVTDDVNSTIATVAGSFQSGLGCPGDWDPACLRSWMQDPDGDGVYEFSTDEIPAGSYAFKVALDETFDVSYPASDLPFTSAAGDTVNFTFDTATSDVTVTVDPLIPTVTIAGSQLVWWA